MSLLSSILSPSFLVRNIYAISLVVSVIILVTLQNKMNTYVVFPIADLIKIETAKEISKTKAARKVPFLKRVIPEWIATILFILYIYFGTRIATSYIIAPILTRLSSVIVPVLIIIFLLTNYFIHSISWRKRLFGINAEKR